MPKHCFAELLSQLSSVRNRAAAAQTVSSQLQQLEMQLQTTRLVTECTGVCTYRCRWTLKGPGHVKIWAIVQWRYCLANHELT